MNKNINKFIGLFILTLLVLVNLKIQKVEGKETIIKRPQVKTVVLQGGQPLKVKPLYNRQDLSQPSRVSLEDMRLMLKGTALESIAPSYIKAEKEHGVNAIALAALSIHESGWGESDRAIRQKNLTGYNVTSPSAEGTTFSSWDHSIQGTARLLGKEYLSPKGKYYNGLSLDRVNIMYCKKSVKSNGEWVSVPDYSWSDSIDKIAKQLISRLEKGGGIND